MAVQDRRELIASQNQITGIDFVSVDAATETVLDVFFLREPGSLAPPLPLPPPAAVRISSESGGEGKPTVPVLTTAFVAVGARTALRVTTPFPGAFAVYQLFIDSPRIDRYFNAVDFRFQAHCPTEFDCAAKPPECPPEDSPDANVDYTARDFWSFRQALIDFSSERHPRWLERVEADAGMMMLETLAALADELSYTQDFCARQAYLEQATEPRSIRRLANLVDYDPHHGLGASTWLNFTVNAGGVIPAGTPVSDLAGGIVFEAGLGLRHSYDAPVTNFPVSIAINAILPHIWSDDATCLEAGATSLWIRGHHKVNLQPDDLTPGLVPGKWVLLQTRPLNPAQPARAWVVRVIDVVEDQDLVIDPIGGPVDISKITWEEAQATPFDLDLESLTVHGNIVPATAGRSMTRIFSIAPAANGQDEVAVERQGPDTLPDDETTRSISLLYSLPGTGSKRLIRAVPFGSPPPPFDERLVWLNAEAGRVEPRAALPEVRLREVDAAGNPVAGADWRWTRSLVGAVSAQPGDPVFTIEEGTWTRAAVYRRIGKEIVHSDYVSPDGDSLRFGVGEFGRIPPDGARFQATYRTGRGAEDNVSAGTLTQVSLGIVDAVTNPLPAINGADREPIADIREYAPEAFRAETFRAVRTEDYAAAALKLEWVDRASAEFRWTGSWLTCFTTADPKGGIGLAANQRTELREQLDRYRQIGRPAFERSPVYANLDLVIYVCVERDAYRGEVKEQILQALSGRGGYRPQPGFFSPDNFTFGTPLDRAPLEAAIQNVPGVRGVEWIFVRRRGFFAWRFFFELSLAVAGNEVIRVENNALMPERGSVKLVLMGGA